MAKFSLLGWGLNTVPQPGLNGRAATSRAARCWAARVRSTPWSMPRPARGLRPLGGAGQPGLVLGRRAALLQALRAQRARGDALSRQRRPAQRDGPALAQPLWRVVCAGRRAGRPSRKPDFNGAQQEGVGLYQVTHKNGERFSAAKAYLTPNLSRPNLQVFTGAHTTRILLEGNARWAWNSARGRSSNSSNASARCCCAPAPCSRRRC
jgi:choline dehydrogenase-like flavoprotein